MYGVISSFAKDNDPSHPISCMILEQHLHRWKNQLKAWPRQISSS